ncbi:cellulase family glycosylhydrolase [Mycobacterium sp. BMJ-28]
MRHASYDVINTATIEEAPSTIGVAESNLYSMSNAEIDKALDKMLSLGVNDVRIGVFWRSIQPLSATNYDWAKTDYIVKAAADRGMGILGVLNQTPMWAGALGNGHPDPDAYAKFAAAVAQRYAGKISAYEIWNEPNGFYEWNPVDAVSYTTMLKKAYTAIKAVAATTNQDIKVIGGVVGAGLTLGNLSLDPVSFITQMYANGAKGYFDALSFHPYNYTLKFSLGPANTWPGTSALAQLQAIRALMNVKGDGDLKIWISEYGQPTMTGTAADQQQQAEYLKDMILSWQSFLNGGPIFIYNGKDTGAPDSTVKEDHLGLFDYFWNEKAAADVIRKLILQLSGTTPTIPTPGNPASGLGGLAQQIATAVINMVGSIMNFIPMTAKMLVNAVKNLLGGIFGKPAVTAASARVASAVNGAITAPAVTADSVTATAEVDGNTPAATATTVTKHESGAAATDATEVATEEKPVSAEAGTDEATTVAAPVTDEKAGTEVLTPTEPVSSTAPSTPEVTEPVTDTKTDDTKTGTDTAEPKPAAATDTKSDTKSEPKADTASTPSDTSAPKADTTTGDKVTRPGTKFGAGEKGAKPKAGPKGKHGSKPNGSDTESGTATPAARQESKTAAGAHASSGSGDSE